MKVIIESHNPAWALEYARVEKELQQILAAVPIISIQHTGSTSIPDLLAKPILDIVISVPASAVPATSDALVGADYLARGEMGVPQRFMFRQPATDKKEMTRHTYVCVDGCLSIRNHLDMKKMLLENAELRREYGEVKRRLVESSEVRNVDDYCRGKTEIVLKILKAAGWSDEDLEEVSKVNV